MKRSHVVDYADRRGRKVIKLTIVAPDIDIDIDDKIIIDETEFDIIEMTEVPNFVNFRWRIVCG